jgi:hypothetical protein
LRYGINWFYGVGQICRDAWVIAWQVRIENRRELRRYQHLREELKRKTVDLIAGVLKEAEKNGKGTSSSRLLHGASKKANSKPKKQS